MENKELVDIIRMVMKEELKDTNSRLDTMQAGLDATNGRLDVMQAGLDAANCRLYTVQAGLDAANCRLDAMQAGLDATNSRLDITNNRLYTVQTGLDSTNTQLDAVQKELKTMHDSITKLEIKQDVSSRKTDDLIISVKVLEHNMKKEFRQIHDAQETLIAVMELRGVLLRAE